MEVRASYKHTESGVIPIDWEAKLLNQLVLFINGKAHENYIEENGKYIVANSKFISSGGKVKKYSDYCLAPAEYRSVLMVMSDVPNGKAIAKCFLVDKDNYYTVNQRVCSLKARSDIPEFLFYAIDRNKYFLTFDDGVQQTNLKKDDILKSPIAVPPTLVEQSAIATALSDADALINSLEKLIDKKRHIKQATMQVLLTSEKRLPGFRGERENLNMAEKSILKARIGWQGLTTAEYLESGDFYLVTGTDFQHGRVNWSGCWFVNRNRYMQDTNIQLKVKDVLLTKDGTIGKVGYVDSLPGSATLNSGVFVIRPRNNAYDPLYFYYVLNSHIFKNFLTKLQAGSTISHLYQKDFVNFNFMAPGLLEQTAIAQLLSDMDSEIEALERKLEKYRFIKQGMMQELLTGHKRLI